MTKQRLKIKSNGNPADTSIVIETTDENGAVTLTPLLNVETMSFVFNGGGEGYAMLSFHAADVDLDLDATVPREQALEALKVEKEPRR